MKKAILTALLICIMAVPAFAKKEGDVKETRFINYTGVAFTTLAATTYTSAIDVKGYKQKQFMYVPVYVLANSTSWGPLTTNPGALGLQGSYQSASTNANWFDIKLSSGTGAVYSTAAAAVNGYYYWEDSVPYVRIKVSKTLVNGGSAGTGFNLILRASGNE